MIDKAYIFDMDGVLADNCRYHVLAWRAFSARHGHMLTDEQVLAWMGAANRVYMERLLGRPVADAELTALENEKEALYRELYAPHLQMPTGLREFLDRTHAAGIPCGIATGAPLQNIDFILDGLNLRRDFLCIVDPSQYSKSKPAPDCYLRAAERLGVARARCTVFEDAVGGIKAARAAGMRVVAITTTNRRETLQAAGADRIIDSFTELC
ncbi:MAG: HAD family phosphatase [Kiritimatiellae bacterium]|nr:HAD family phosphatase [Kiritimatiellia bacterium]